MASLNNLRPLALAASMSVGALAFAGAAHATTILTFSQSGTSNEVVGTETGSTTTITATNAAISIGTIASTTPIASTAAFLDLSLTSTDAATTFGGNILQDFSGSFSVTSAANGAGTDYLSGTLTDIAFGQNASFGITASTPTNAVTFKSSDITILGLDRAVALSFTNVTPGLSIVNGSIAPFTGNISGTFSAQPTAVPEPASLALLGAGLLGLGMIRRRRA